MKSIIYWHPEIYTLFMKLLCGRHYRRRYIELRNLIDSNSSLLDVCCGDCKLYEFLKDKNIEYTGLDFNPIFIKKANERRINARLCNIHKDNIPSADYVVIQSSLYQFIPEHVKVLQKLFKATNRYLVISECLNSYSVSKSWIFSYVGKKLNNPGDGIKALRFNMEMLKEAIEPFRGDVVKEFFAGNKTDYIVVIRKNNAAKSDLDI